MFDGVPGVEEVVQKPIKRPNPTATIIAGPIQLPKHGKSRIYDITGRRLYTSNPGPGIYFLEINGEIVQKIVKVK
ncbi:MAG TPA: T9SS type A sorting domain-containing protein [candidate division WOR-3 bacterium]|uniref:T9SS type A sorting domain-containing protein n=1 Tax=candidate division WOR-3 bacterium TaxID=2052148 RepID=A0A9C9JZJ2_UNCW3|nr:T9SS type A sorting domain-containing protein [candidate division WOR-3 bacterium]